MRDSLGPWLHRVACRVAVRAKQSTVRRKAAERTAAETARRAAELADEDEIVGVLHEEIDRLPGRFRIPVVLCDLEGRTYEEAARHLGCPVGTVKSRLARGRERLRGELSGRGFSPSKALSAALLSAEVPSLPLPRTALESVAAATWQVVSAKVHATGTIPDAVLTLTNGVLRSMSLTRWKSAFVLVLALAGVGSGIAWTATQAPLIAQDSVGPKQIDDRDPRPPTRGRSNSRSGSVPTDEGVASQPFDEIRVDGNIRVIVSPGPEHRLTMIGGATPHQSLRTRVENRSKVGRLVLEMPTPDGKPERGGAQRGRLEVRITAPRLAGVIAEGSSTVEVGGLKAEALAVTVSDLAKVAVEGTGKEVTAVLGDDGEFDASRLEVEAAKVTASGRSKGVFFPRKSLNLMSSGDARVEYLGNPDRVNKITSEKSILSPR